MQCSKYQISVSHRMEKYDTKEISGILSKYQSAMLDTKSKCHIHAMCAYACNITKSMQD